MHNIHTYSISLSVVYVSVDKYEGGEEVYEEARLPQVILLIYNVQLLGLHVAMRIPEHFICA